MKYKKYILVLLASLMLAPLHAWCADLIISVGNSTILQRKGLVELSLDTIKSKLGLTDDDAFVVLDAYEQQVEYQVTHDNKVLIDAAVRPRGVGRYHIRKGFPILMKTWATGKVYPTRLDDLAWENDLCAFRVYGPALQRTGERSFGIDTWTKTSPEPSVEARYMRDYDGNVRENAYRKEGKKDEASIEELNTSFHVEHGMGLDCYDVGASLGCGAPAIMLGDSLVMPYCYVDYEILDNGPLRFTVSLTQAPIMVGNDSVVEHRVISLDKGSHFNKMTVWYDGFVGTQDMAAGVVIHSVGDENVIMDNRGVLYADPTDNPDKHNFQIYVGALFPNGAETMELMYPKPKARIYGHAVGIVRGLKANQPYTYYFGSASSNYDVPNIVEWGLCAERFLDSLRKPLTVTYE